MLLFSLIGEFHRLGRYLFFLILIFWALIGGLALYVSFFLILLYFIYILTIKKYSEIDLNLFFGASVSAFSILISKGNFWLQLIGALPLLPLIFDFFLGLLMAFVLGNRALLPLSLFLKNKGSLNTLNISCSIIGLGWLVPIGYWVIKTENSYRFAVVMAAAPLFFGLLVLFSLAVANRDKISRHLDIGNREGKKIKGLDGLRAIAVLLVVFSHVGLMESEFWVHSGLHLYLNANVGVQLFFVLSGFLITMILFREYEAAGSISVCKFYLRRVLRIFPVYYAAIGFSFALTASQIYSIKEFSFFSAIFYFFNFLSFEYMESTFSHFWSLAVEEHFYLFWPFVFYFFVRKPNFILYISIALIVLLCFFISNPFDWFVNFSDRFYINRWTVPAVLPILVGCFLGSLSNFFINSVRLAFISGLSLFLVLWMLLIELPDVAPSYSMILVSSFGLGMIVLFVFTYQDSLIVHALEFRPLAYLGMISYGVYVWQGIFTGNGPYRSHLYWPPDPILGAMLSIFLAMFSYKYFEKPIILWKSRLSEFGAKDFN